MKRFMIVFAFILSTVLQVSAQDLFSESIVKTHANKEDVITYFKKSIVIDAENYNITIDYVEDDYKTLIFSGIAKGLGNITATSRVTNIANGFLEFKVEMTCLEDSEEWLFKPQKLVFTYKENAYSRISHLPTSMLQELKNELEVIMIHGPRFVLDSHFFKRLDEYKNEQDNLLAVVNNTELKKKEREKAKSEYESAAAKYKIYNDVYEAAQSVLVRIILYYLP